MSLSKTMMNLRMTPLLMLMALCPLTRKAEAQFRWITTHNGWAQGGCELIRSASKATLHSTYVEMEEEAEIETQGTVFSGDPRTLEIVGTITLPPGSIIQGMLLWNGPVVLKAKLKSRDQAGSEYEKVVNRDTPPPPQPRDPALIEYLGPNSYLIRIYPVTQGSSRRIRLKYVVPMQYDGLGLNLSLHRPIAGTFGSSATKTVFTVEKAPGAPQKLVLDIDGLRRQYDFPVTFLEPPGRRISVLSEPRPKALAAMTSFAAGEFQGHYLNLIAPVPQAIAAHPTLRQEVVVLWRWHSPRAFIAYAPYNREYLANEGWTAKNQGQALARFYQEIAPQNIAAALVHDDGRDSLKVFKMARGGEKPFMDAQAYLASLDDSYLLSHARSFVAKWEPSTDTLKGRKENRDRFGLVFRYVRAQFSADKGVVRHIVVASTGGVDQAWDSNLEAHFDSLFSGLKPTVSGISNNQIYEPQSGTWFNDPAPSASFRWPGFDPQFLGRNYGLRSGMRSYGQVALPAPAPFSLEATVKNAEKNYNIGIQCGETVTGCQPLSFNGKAATAWNKTVEWRLFDKDGAETYRLIDSLPVFEKPGDSVIAALWAGSAAPFSESREGNLGIRYGFIDANASMLALEGDSLRREDWKKFEKEGVPALTAKDIIRPETTYVYRRPGGIGGIPTGLENQAEIGLAKALRLVRLDGKALRLVLPPELVGKKILDFEIRSLQGRVWIRQKNQRIENGSIRFEAEGLKAGAYLLIVRSGSTQWTSRVWIP